MPGDMPTMLYVSCADDKLIVGFAMDPDTGALRETSRTPVPGTDEPSRSSMPLALSPDRQFLYAALRTAPFPVSSFAIDAGAGTLRHLGTATLPDSMCYLSTDPAGTRLFSASYGGACLGVSPIVDGVAGHFTQRIPTPPKAHCARPDPAGRFVYAACLGGDVLLAQRFEGGALDGIARPVAATAAGAGPRHIAFARDRLYCLNELDGSLNRYDRDEATGALHERQSISALPHAVTGNAAAADLHLTPDGRFLYASVRQTNTLAGFQVDPETGHLALIGHVPSEPEPRGFAITPGGKFLLCAGLKSGTVATYAIDPQTGALARLGDVQTGAGPNWIECFDTP